VSEPQTGIPELPCPNCAANILQKGFYNYCSETSALREDNFTFVRDGRLLVDHNEKDHELTEHECDLEAFCQSCDKPLPWAPYEIRELDYKSLPEAQELVAELLAREASEEQADLPAQDQAVAISYELHSWRSNCAGSIPRTRRAGT
jgi:hypothetical protein